MEHDDFMSEGIRRWLALSTAIAFDDQAVIQAEIIEDWGISESQRLLAGGSLLARVIGELALATNRSAHEVILEVRRTWNT
ncbi:hypothetical protein ACIPY5_12045 [Microbacterium sp. NPDC089698]|uniref:hypothetical protein n=1 Tax=Microbacterium sp. NPDC089698 TaxID=3364200 RepID=UPI003811BCA5